MIGGVVVVGGAGRLAKALRDVAPTAHFLDRRELDITDPRSISVALDRLEPKVVINTAAIADVDRCEADPGLANQVNAYGAQALAQKCAERGIGLIHTSTDYVFASRERVDPFREDATHCPCNAYGRSKALGETLVQNVSAKVCVARVSWLFGHPQDFLQTMVRKAAAGQVIDLFRQTGSPTPLSAVADRYLLLAEAMSAGKPVPPILNIAGGPPASRAQWLDAALAGYSAKNKGFLPIIREVDPPTDRPAFSALATDAATAYFGNSIDWRTDAINLEFDGL